MELLATPFNEISQNTLISNQENAVENVVCKMLAILSRPQCVKKCQCVNAMPMAADDLAIQGVRASAAMLLT